MSIIEHNQRAREREGIAIKSPIIGTLGYNIYIDCSGGREGRASRGLRVRFDTSLAARGGGRRFSIPSENLMDTRRNGADETAQELVWRNYYIRLREFSGGFFKFLPRPGRVPNCVARLRRAV